MAAKKKAKKAAKKVAKKAAKKTAKKAAPKKVAKKAAKAAPKKVAKKAAPKKKAPKKAAAPAAAPAPEAPAADAGGAESAAEGSGDGSSEPPRGRPASASTAASPATGNAAVKVGDAAPPFELRADDESTVKLSDLRGRRVVLYFYPRDSTPGCEMEARDFSTLEREFGAKNAVVFGVSTDNLDSHRKFKRNCDLTIRLLTDPEKQVHGAYGAWGEKNMYGRKTMGTIRSTFLIDEDGKIARVWPKVKVQDHALDVLNSLDPEGPDPEGPDPEGPDPEGPDPEGSR